MDAITALSALAQEHRLEAFRRVAQAGHKGIPAGQIATALGIPANSLSFHLDRLRQAKLVTIERQGRSIVYTARFDTMEMLLGYLTDNCCEGHPELCRPQACEPAPPRRNKAEIT